MNYKKIFSVLFSVVVFSIMLVTLVFMAVFGGSFSENFPLRNSLLSLKTVFLDITGVEEFDNVYRAEDRLIKVSGPTNQKNTNENTNIILEVSKRTTTPFYFSLVPTAEYIERASLNRRALVWDQGKYIDEIYYNVIESSNIIDITETLLNCSDDNIYFKTSDRISPRGGYYIFQTVLRKLGNQSPNIQKYDIEYYKNNYQAELSKSFIGANIYDTIAFYRYPLFRREIIMRVTDKNANSIVYKDVYCKDKNGFDVYMGGENPITIITNTETQSEKLLVISDYTFNVSSGFFVDYFNEITVINPTVTSNKLKKINMDNYDYVLVLFSTETFNSKSLNSLLNIVE